MGRSFVVTGGGRGVGKAIVERLVGEVDHVVAIELEEAHLQWTVIHPQGRRIIPVIGDAAEEGVAERAADLAQEAGRLSGWVNNCAVFRDASAHEASSKEILELIAQNLNPAVVGCAVAVRRFLSGGGGAIVNVSSYQAQRPVPGCMPYATAKAAIEGLTRSLAVEYGRQAIRVNAVALGAINTERYTAFLGEQTLEEAERIEAELAALHPVGRIGRPEEVAATVAHLLSGETGFINGAVVPIDGGRSVLSPDPET